MYIIYYEDKIVVTYYTETIKKLEDEGNIECRIVDNSDFYTLYVLLLKTELTNEIEEDLIKAIVEEAKD